MARYRTKSCEIEAIQWTDNTNEIKSFCGNSCTYSVEEQCMGSWKGIPIERLVIHTLEGDMVARRNDYIIKGLKGEFYPCKPDVFNQKYKLINDTMEIQEEQRWIPVTERLPEDGDLRFYMCVLENHEEDLPVFCQYEEGFGFGFWQDYYDEYTLGFIDSEFHTNEELEYEKVIAWMPLPDPYKGENNHNM